MNTSDTDLENTDWPHIIAIKSVGGQKGLPTAIMNKLRYFNMTYSKYLNKPSEELHAALSNTSNAISGMINNIEKYKKLDAEKEKAKVRDKSPNPKKTNTNYKKEKSSMRHWANNIGDTLQIFIVCCLVAFMVFTMRACNEQNPCKYTTGKGYDILDCGCAVYSITRDEKGNIKEVSTIHDYCDKSPVVNQSSIFETECE